LIVQHTEFVEAFKRGTVEVDVDRSKALQIANAWEKVPHSFRAAHVFWSCAWLLTIPAAFAAAFLYAWWAGTLILLVLTPALFTAAKKSAALHVIEYAVESSAFYSYAVDNSIISIRQKS
jgi:ABC-type spermidine/putrescine transport system permease subunit I